MQNEDIGGGSHDRCETSASDALSQPLLADGDHDYNKPKEVLAIIFSRSKMWFLN